jgi:Rrf2 family protein
MALAAAEVAMRVASGVEWAAHACITLAALGPRDSLKAAHLAELLDVPPAYLAKQMQALSKAGIVTTGRGPNGGYRLAQPDAAINLWDIYIAVEGADSFYQSSEIRQKGPCAASPDQYPQTCGIASLFDEAQVAYRNVLRSTSLERLAAIVNRQVPLSQLQARAQWLATRRTRDGSPTKAR